MRYLALLMVAGAALGQVAPDSRALLSTSDLCVTEGRIEALADGRLAVRVPKMRAYARRADPKSAELRFRYLGSTDPREQLGSGEVREQLGLKLRAQDPCNLVYVMWRILPAARLVVSLKSNPGLHSSSECANHGYREIHPDSQGALPTLRAGDAHRLSADTRGNQLSVFVDDALVWRGLLNDTAAELTGPAGVRSDNVRFEFELAVTPGNNLLSCHTGAPD